MTAKEAIKRFKQPIMLADMDWNKRVETIETALNRLEELEKVLKIIKKYLSVGTVILGDTPNLYTITMKGLEYYELTEAEFNLLKEYLK